MRRLTLILALLVLCSSAAQAMRIGVWILDLKHVKHGNATELANLAKQSGVAYWIVRTHKPWDNGRKADEACWYRLCPEQSFRDLLQTCHSVDVQVYSWLYVYCPGDFSIESAMGKQAVDAGADGLVLNAETEATSRERYDNAAALCLDLRQYIDGCGRQIPLTYSTFGRANEGVAVKFPYVLFNACCDQVWFQSYWATFKKEWTPSYTIRTIDGIAQDKYVNWIERTQADGRPRKRIPWVHTLQAYNGEGNTKYIPPAELREALQTALDQGHSEVNIYAADFMNDEHYAVLREFANKWPDKNKSPYDNLLSDATGTPDLHNRGSAGKAAEIGLPPDPDGDYPPFSFWGSWWGCMTLHIPWWTAWTGSYWTVFWFVIACFSTYAATMYKLSNVRRRQEIAGLGMMVAFLWNYLLGLTLCVFTWCISIAATAVTIGGLIYLVILLIRRRTKSRSF